jgi:hypothetical protein
MTSQCCVSTTSFFCRIDQFVAFEAGQALNLSNKNGTKAFMNSGEEVPQSYTIRCRQRSDARKSEQHQRY